MRAHVLVDDGDYEWLARWRWHLNDGRYAARWICTPTRQLVLMHRLILGLEQGDRRMGEHKNRNTLDCQRDNLRIAERGMLDNGQNRSLNRNSTSGRRGVAWDAERGKWLAQVTVDGRLHRLGRFATIGEADETVRAFRAEHMPFSEDVPS